VLWNTAAKNRSVTIAYLTTMSTRYILAVTASTSSASITYTYLSSISQLRLIRLQITEELKMCFFLVERDTSLLTELQTLLSAGKLVTQPRVLLTHALYLSLLLQPLGLHEPHVTAQQRHHLSTSDIRTFRSIFNCAWKLNCKLVERNTACCRQFLPV